MGVLFLFLENKRKKKKCLRTSDIITKGEKGFAVLRVYLPKTYQHVFFWLLAPVIN